MRLSIQMRNSHGLNGPLHSDLPLPRPPRGAPEVTRSSLRRLNGGTETFKMQVLQTYQNTWAHQALSAKTNRTKTRGLQTPPTRPEGAQLPSRATQPPFVGKRQVAQLLP